MEGSQRQEADSQGVAVHMVGSPGFPKRFARDYFQQPGVGFRERALLLWFMTQPKGMQCTGVGVALSEPLGPGEPCGLSRGVHYFQCVSSWLMSPIVAPFPVILQRHVLLSLASPGSPPPLCLLLNISPRNPLPRVFLRPFPVTVKASIVSWTLTDPSVVG